MALPPAASPPSHLCHWPGRQILTGISFETSFTIWGQQKTNTEIKRLQWSGETKAFLLPVSYFCWTLQKSHNHLEAALASISVVSSDAKLWFKGLFALIVGSYCTYPTHCWQRRRSFFHQQVVSMGSWVCILKSDPSRLWLPIFFIQLWKWFCIPLLCEYFILSVWTLLISIFQFPSPAAPFHCSLAQIWMDFNRSAFRYSLKASLKFL